MIHQDVQFVNISPKCSDYRDSLCAFRKPTFVEKAQHSRAASPYSVGPFSHKKLMSASIVPVLYRPSILPVEKPDP